MLVSKGIEKRAEREKERQREREEKKGRASKVLGLLTFLNIFCGGETGGQRPAN